MHPLDLMKTRFQLQGNAVPGDPGHYKGVILQSSLNTNHFSGGRLHGEDVQAGGAQVLLEGDCASSDGGDTKAWMEGFRSYNYLSNSYFCHSSSPLSSSRRSFALVQKSQLLW